MIASIRIVLLLLLLSGFNIQKVAAGTFVPCMPEKPWSCPGAIEIRYFSEKFQDQMRMQHYENGDVLMIFAVVPSGERRILRLASGSTYYLGFTDQQLQTGLAAKTIEGSLMFAYFLLQSNYPEGVQTVSEQPTQRTVAINGKPKKFMIARVRNSRVNFSMPNPTESSARMEGFWDAQKLESLPDNMSMTGWITQDLKHFGTLGEARANDLNESSRK